MAKRAGNHTESSPHPEPAPHSPLPKALPEQKYTSSNFVPSGYSQSTCFPPPPAATAAARAAAAAARVRPEEPGSNRASRLSPRRLLPLAPLPEPPSHSTASRAREAASRGFAALLVTAQDSTAADEKTAAVAPPHPCCCDANRDSWLPTAAMLAETGESGSGGLRARVEGDEPRRALRSARFMAVRDVSGGPSLPPAG